jgi:hypothetical protein
VADEGAIVREVEAFYQGYIEASNRRDLADIAQCYDCPHVGLAANTRHR